MKTPEISDNEYKKLRQELRNALTCPICGLPKIHSRLRGYHCHNELHNEQVIANEIYEAMKQASKPLKF